MKTIRALSGLLIFCVAPLLLNASPITTNLLTNPGAETGSLSGWTAQGPGTPTVDNGSFDAGINPHTGTYDFTGRTGSSDSLSQTVSLLGAGLTTSQINSGNLSADISFWEQGLSQGTPSDDAYVTVSFLDGSMTVISSSSTPEVDSHNGTWQNYSNSYVIPVGTQYVTYSMDFVRHSGSDLDAFIDDNSLVIDQASPTSTPEPSSFALLGAGLLGLVGTLRRKLS